MNKQISLLAVVGALGLVACSSTPEEPVADTDNQALEYSVGENTDNGLQGTGVGNRETVALTPLEEAAARDAALRRQLVVYFDFDSSQIGDQHLAMLDAHARYLRQNPGARLRLEGHTDERGTREYNIALGERRAEAVRRALLLRGATRAQLLVVSYGEEKPAVLGRGEAAWSRNRRVQLAYQ